MTWYAWFLLFENEVMRTFRDRGALSPETAQTRVELGVRFDSRFNRLAASGVIKTASSGRFYMDEESQARYLAIRRWTAVAVAVGLLGIAFALAAIRG